MGGIGMIGTKAVYNAAMHCDLLLMVGADYLCEPTRTPDMVKIIYRRPCWPAGKRPNSRRDSPVAGIDVVHPGETLELRVAQFYRRSRSIARFVCRFDTTQVEAARCLRRCAATRPGPFISSC